ncbi:MAG: glycosyltransferase family 61 protein [Selenomonadaceae bacterium]|nr:glycosyltransferase family 61 protein [Selenomonadaceae bacterium]
MSNYDQWSDLVNKKFLSERKLNVQIIENGIILPAKDLGRAVYGGGVFSKEGEFIAGFFRKKPPKNTVFGVQGAYEIEELYESDEEVIFGGALISLFGHFILESLGRMWYILKNPGDKRKIIFLLVKEEQEWFYQFFKLLDIDINRIEILKKPTHYRKIIIPDESIHSWYDYTEEYLVPYNYIRDKIKVSDIKKLYLTRSKVHLKGREIDRLNGNTYLCNEEYFEQFYKGKGYKVISPEKFPVEEQISMVAGADEVVSTLGSLSHWALFCKSKTKFTMLARVDDDTLYPQCLINEAKNIDWRIIDVSMNFLPLQNRGTGVCLLGETKYWKRFVEEFYNEKIFSEYWREKIDEYVSNWCYYCSIDNAAPLLTRVIKRTYDLAIKNNMSSKQDEMMKILLQRTNFLQGQIQSINNSK